VGGSRTVLACGREDIKGWQGCQWVDVRTRARRGPAESAMTGPCRPLVRGDLPNRVIRDEDCLASLQELLKPMENWTQKEPTQAEVKVFILDRLFETLPNPPYSTD
jgi:hypothetical protein